MTTLENRPNTALLVIDVQNGVVGGAYERNTVVANVGTVVEKLARRRYRSSGCSTRATTSRREASSGRSFRS